MKFNQNVGMVKMIRHTLAPSLVTLLALIGTCGATFAQTAQGVSCGNLANHYGPFDYRVDKDKLGIVEHAHFTPAVENLISGNTDSVGADINYTLHTFPNHHRALLSMAKLGEKQKTNQPKGANFTVECYFERAVRFQPSDTIARALYAQYLLKNGRKNESITQLDIANQYAKENPFSIFNIGLLYFEAGAFDKALTQAQRAQELGFPRTELIDMLKQANKWQDPPQK
ncbi:tetratricopeptide repeat protein [Variovorax sp. HJSM1_2]|uniref:tetratricopeptide repeat protein n=1 Tax=Variovorax sp. HJSM1_2 TaxID=3366263 RepID=UPI003BDD41B8